MNDNDISEMIKFNRIRLNKKYLFVLIKKYLLLIIFGCKIIGLNN